MDRSARSRGSRLAPPALSDLDLDALAAKLAPLVASILVARLAEPSKPASYSTRRGETPPGFAVRVWQRIAPKIPGAVKRGRWWIVTGAQLEAWERASSTETSSPAPKLANPAWDPESALASVGLRSTKAA